MWYVIIPAPNAALCSDDYNNADRLDDLNFPWGDRQPTRDRSRIGTNVAVVLNTDPKLTPVSRQSEHLRTSCEDRLTMALLTTTTAPLSSPNPAAKAGVLPYNKTIEADAIVVAAIELIRAQDISVAGLLHQVRPSTALMWASPVPRANTTCIVRWIGPTP